MKKILLLIALLPLWTMAQKKPDKCPPGWERQPEKHPICSCNNGDQFNTKKPYCGCPSDWKKKSDQYPWCQPLPITLVSFSVRAADAACFIKWEFIEPVNHSHFLLERSSDAITWEIIASLEDTKVTDYPDCGTWYYRLTSVDLDGTLHPYQIEAVKIYSCNPKEPVYNLKGQRLEGNLRQQVIIKGRKKIYQN